MKVYNQLDYITKIGDISKEHTGCRYTDNTQCTLSFNNSNRTLTITIVNPITDPLEIYVKNRLYTFSSNQNIQIPNTEGNWFVYLDENGAFQVTNSFTNSIITDYAFITSGYWDLTNQVNIWLLNERHGLTLDGATHLIAHKFFGSQYYSGFGLSGFNIGTGSVDANAQFTFDLGTWSDEDIPFSYTSTSQVPIVYRTGIGNWKRKPANANPFIENNATLTNGAGGTVTIFTGTGRPAYNQFTGGNWQLTEVSEGAYFNVHYAVFNDEIQKVVGFLGTQEYFSPYQARNNIGTEINVIKEQFPLNEFIFIGSVLFEASSSFANTNKARVINYDLVSGNYKDLRPLNPKNLLTLNDIFGLLRQSQIDNFKENFISLIDVDFVNNSLSTTANASDFQSVLVGNGSSTSLTTLNNFDSVIANSTGTNNSGSAYYRTNGVISFSNSKTYEMWMEFDVQWSAVSSATQRYSTRIGLASTSFVSDPTAGIFIRYVDNVNSGNIQCVCRNAGIETVLNSTVAGGTGKVKVRVQIINGTDVYFYLNGVKVSGSITTNIPLNTNMFFGGGIVKSVGTTACLQYTDYFNSFIFLYSGR